MTTLSGLTATLAEGVWTLDGQQPAVRAGASAGGFVLGADVVDTDGVHAHGIVVLVPVNAAGVDVSPAHAQIGQDLTAEVDLTLTDVRIPAAHALRVEDGLKDGLRDYIRISVLLEAAGAVGVAQQTFDASTRYVQERLQGGRVIVTYPAMAQLVARMATSLETMRAVTYRAARAVQDDWRDATALVLMARLHTAETAGAIGRWGMEIHGGSGVMREMGIERHYRDAVAFRNGVTRDAQRFAIAKALLPAAPGRCGGPENALDLLTA